MNELSVDGRRESQRQAADGRILRQRLAAYAALPPLRVLARQQTPGGDARKHLLELADGARIEVVLMRYGQRTSGCISTQVGCACGCAFCATGQMGFVRHLTEDEIVAQVLYLQRERAESGRLLSNFVLMGMGEPLLNYEASVSAVRRLVDPRGAAFTPRRITLSSVGVAPGIRRLAAEGLGLQLAVSLHAATDALRDELIPANRRWPLAELFAALQAYAARTRRRVLLEWVMVDGVNDTAEQAEALVARLAGLAAHVNLIQLNPTPFYHGRPSAAPAVAAFIERLDRAGIPHTMRQRRGAEIAAGCGQLGLAARADLRDSRVDGTIALQSNTDCVERDE
jgi:23S rRNA (adenine2503-C2)-methyltransferase